MKKFSGDWTAERLKDLVEAHKGASHDDTATRLTDLWGCRVSRDSVKNKYNSVVPKEKREKKEVEAAITRDSLVKSHSDESHKVKRTYFVTSAIAGCDIHKGFFAAIKNFCNAGKVRLVVLPMRGAIKKGEEFSNEVLNELVDNFYTDYTFNSNIQAFDLGISPTQVNPLIGLQGISKKSSIIVASPKQSLETVPVSNLGMPHIIASTGAITTPDYSKNRAGMLASGSHVIGGLIVEIQDNEVFHLRQVQADVNGTFYDLNKKYSSNGVTTVNIEAFVPGDIHIGEEEPSALKAVFEIMTTLKPKQVFLHDLVNAKSCTHHMQNNITDRANLPEIYRTLSNELTYVGKTIENWSTKFPKIDFKVVQSNHPEHIDRYLDEGRFVLDPPNYRTALELAGYRLDGLNVIEAYLDKRIGKLKNFKWLKRDQDLKIKGCQLAVHGDKGNNGSRGSATGVEKSYGNAIIGHSHSPKIIRNTYQVGTTTKLRLDYTQGASSWLHCSAVLYENGSKSLIISIDGKWRN